MRSPYFALATLSTLTLLACGGAEPIGQATAAIINGKDAPEHRAVGLLVYDSETPGEDKACSSSLIAADLVLTAAHCVTTPQTPYEQLEPLYFFVGADAGLDPLTGSPTGSVHLVKSIAYHPAYAGAAVSDVAVVRISPPVRAEIATPLPLAASAPQVGQAATLVGFGLSKADDASTAGTRRQGKNYVAQVDPTTFTFTDENAELGLGCVGDSGGPTLADIGGVSSILGIQAGVPDGSCRTTIDMRVDVYRNWIENQMALLRGLEPPHAIDPSLEAGAPYGAECTSNASCRSQTCLTIKSFWKTRRVCSQACDAQTPCPSGDECHDSGYCLAKRTQDERQIESVNTTPSVQVNGGCAAGSSPHGALPVWTLALLLGLMLLRRRR